MAVTTWQQQLPTHEFIIPIANPPSHLQSNEWRYLNPPLQAKRLGQYLAENLDSRETGQAPKSPPDSNFARHSVANSLRTLGL